MRIIHVSFSTNVLIVPNPFFLKAAAQALAELAQIDFQEAVDAFVQTENACNQAAEQAGIAFSSDTIYEALMIAVNIEPGQAPEFRRRVERLFEMMPPKVSTEAIQAFDMLRENNFTISVAANTNFVTGAMLDEYLRKILGKYSFGAYSDLIGTAQPSPTFYRRVVDAVAMRHEKDVFPSTICHIGSNPQVDGFGPTRCGLSSIVLQPQGVEAAVRALIEQQLALIAAQPQNNVEELEYNEDEDSDDFDDNPFA